jgi:hypothetical protein
MIQRIRDLGNMACLISLQRELLARRQADIEYWRRRALENRRDLRDTICTFRLANEAGIDLEPEIGTMLQGVMDEIALLEEQIP